MHIVTAHGQTHALKHKSTGKYKCVFIASNQYSIVPLSTKNPTIYLLQSKEQTRILHNLKGFGKGENSDKHRIRFER